MSRLRTTRPTQPVHRSMRVSLHAHDDAMTSLAARGDSLGRLTRGYATTRIRFSIGPGLHWDLSSNRRCIRAGFCSPDLADIHDLYISSDEKLFNKILTCPNHILRTLLPPSTAQNYSLRNRHHNRQLPDRISRITDCNFTVRMLYRNMH